ncbi:hypothetical protein BH09PSE1_BH09PSE1_16330 [soil metagenome]
MDCTGVRYDPPAARTPKHPMDHSSTHPDEIIFVAGSTEAGRRAACEAVRRVFPEGVPGKAQLERVVHATLVLAGSADDPRTVPVATETAALIRLPRFELVFDTLTVFGGPKGVLALTCSAVPPEWSALRKQLSQAPRRLRRPIEGGAAPHLTVGYTVAPMAPIRLAEAVVWVVDEFVLVRSLYGQSEHRELGRWSLQ